MTTDTSTQALCGKQHADKPGVSCSRPKHEGSSHYDDKAGVYWTDNPCGTPHPNLPGVTCGRDAEHRQHNNGHDALISSSAEGRAVRVVWFDQPCGKWWRAGERGYGCLGQAQHRGDHHSDVADESAPHGFRHVTHRQPLSVELVCPKCGGTLAISQTEAQRWILTPWEGDTTGHLPCPFCQAERGGLYTLEAREKPPRGKGAE
jgi:hypothetical protein